MNMLGIRQKELEATEERPLESVSGSYTYFADGDVLLAKIAPCFENSKLGIAHGLTNGVGFGSSEIVVFRPDESLDAEYLFYFLSQDSFCDAGASVMSGAVGHKVLVGDGKNYVRLTPQRGGWFHNVTDTNTAPLLFRGRCYTLRHGYSSRYSTPCK